MQTHDTFDAIVSVRSNTAPGSDEGSGMGSIRRVTMNVDAGLLRAAEAVLGTSGVTDTVNRSLGEVVRRDRLRRLAERRFPDLTPETVRDMRRIRDL